MSDSTVPVQSGQGASASAGKANRAGDLADGLIRDFHPATALSVGNGEGHLVAALRDRGVDASGIEDFEPIEGRYDLVVCVSPLEELSAEAADTAMAGLCAATDRIVISLAQDPQDWAAKLAERGFARDLDRDLSYISPWAATFVRGDESQVETVRRYDRAWLQLRQEVAEVRRSLQEQRQRIAELEGGDHPKLEQSEAEILRLRDLLVGKEAELGVAVGKVAELEHRVDWLTALKHWRNRIRGALSKVPGLKRLKRLIRRR